MAFRRDLFYDIFFIRGTAYAPVALSGIPQAEAIVMAGDERDVLHAGSLGSAHPGGRIEGDGIENVFEAAVFFHPDVAVIHDPFPMSENAAGTPMDEHAETGAVEPVTCSLVLGRGPVILGLGGQ